MPSAAQYLPDFYSLENDKGIEIKVCQCSKCGLVQLNNQPVHYYREVIRASGISNEMKKFRIKEVLIPTYYSEDITECSVGTSFKYGLDVLKLVGTYVLYRLGINLNKKLLG